MSWLKSNQQETIIKNCVESIMEDLDDFYFDELFMKWYKKELLQFFKKIVKEYGLFEMTQTYAKKKRRGKNEL